MLRLLAARYLCHLNPRYTSVLTLKLKEEMDEEALSSKVTYADVLDGEIIVCKAFEPLTIGVVRQLLALGQKSLKVVDTNEDEILIKSLKKDPATNEEEASEGHLQASAPW